MGEELGEGVGGGVGGGVGQGVVGGVGGGAGQIPSVKEDCPVDEMNPLITRAPNCIPGTNSDRVHPVWIPIVCEAPPSVTTHSVRMSIPAVVTKLTP